MKRTAPYDCLGLCRSVAGPRSQLEPLLCNGISGMTHYHFSVTPCSTHYAALAHALLTGLLARIIHAILYLGISKVFAVTVKTSQQLCRASERRVENSVVPVCIDPQPCRQVAMLGLDFVNLPSLLILSVSQLPDQERCQLPDRMLSCANSAACLRPRDTGHRPSVCRW